MSFEESTEIRFLRFRQRWCCMLVEAIRDNVQLTRWNDASRRERSWRWFSCLSRIAWIFWSWTVCLRRSRWDRESRDKYRFSMFVIDFIHDESRCFWIIVLSKIELSHRINAALICLVCKEYRRRCDSWNRCSSLWWSWICLTTSRASDSDDNT